MQIKDIVKSFFPSSAWNRIRQIKILTRHSRIVKELTPLIESCDNIPDLELKQKILFRPEEKIIWQYWGQGFNDNLPQMVKICLKSVDRYATDYRIIRLTDENVDMYIDIPEWIKHNAAISKAHFSDILRVLLVSTYGGVWLDCCIFLTGPIPDLLHDRDCFLYRRSQDEPDKEYWEESFAYYFSWHPKFRVNVLAGFLAAKPGNREVKDIAKMLVEYWKSDNELPDYFFIQFLWSMYNIRYPERTAPGPSDCPPHLLRQYINGNPYPGMSVEDILHITNVHSLNYKNKQAVKNLLSLFPEYK